MVKSIFFLNKVDSTQILAKSFIPFKKDLIIVAKSQEKGYGRFQRNWYSPEGGLYFSFLLNLEENFLYNSTIFDIVFHIVKSVVLSCEELFNLKEKLQIKWPNDIYYQDKKLCGILAEKENNFLIVGCGINVNEDCFPSFLEKAISLKMILRRTITTYERYLLLENIFYKSFFKKIEKEELVNFLKARNYLKNKKIRVALPNKEIIDICLDIADDYSLILSSGKKITTGEVVKVFYE
uniref:Biotin--[acetyl-CoA-carboxylase] ligase n=1 Tax=candidate division WOR-3 bacterium TaxID=2052148 RepID=A0A7V3ZUM3_UNCW3